MGLDVLFLNDNAFSGLIPDAKGSTPAHYLPLAKNRFAGHDHATIGGPKNLEEVILSGNQISSPPPAEFASIKNLIILAMLAIISLLFFNVSNNLFSKPWAPACQELLAKEILDASFDCNKEAEN